jgi:hypothetical protein
MFDRLVSSRATLYIFPLFLVSPTYPPEHSIEPFFLCLVDVWLMLAPSWGSLDALPYNDSPIAGG